MKYVISYDVEMKTICCDMIRQKRKGNGFMVRRLIADSCADFTSEKKAWTQVRQVPLTLTVGGEDVLDDESFCQKTFLEKMRKAPECPRSACPSPVSLP